jgi:hypothetical protein
MEKNIKVIVSKDRDFPPFFENGISPPPSKGMGKETIKSL